jgi:hypothetical protein
MLTITCTNIYLTLVFQTLRISHNLHKNVLSLLSSKSERFERSLLSSKFERFERSLLSSKFEQFERYVNTNG